MSVPTLYVIPTPLGEDTTISPDIQIVICHLVDYVAESAKSARRFLKHYELPCPLQSISIHELNEHTALSHIPALLKPLKEGRSLGLVSEAGAPGIADPGAALILAAHQAGFHVKPIIGPSSIPLALMASGLDGQRHQFLGYLPTDEAERKEKLKTIEKGSRQQQSTMVFIETPYRNDRLYQAILKTCHPETWLCLASDLTQPTETISTMRIREWKQQQSFTLQKRPTVFLIRAT